LLVAVVLDLQSLVVEVVVELLLIGIFNYQPLPIQ
jgi:hypothetical protein